MIDDRSRAATEQWFIRRGLPHFIPDYDASTDIWTRAAPALALVVLAEIVVLGPKRDFPLWLDVVVVAAAFAALIGIWAFVNRRRGRRLLQRPDDLGPLELVLFVAGPALVPIIAGQQYRQAIVVLIGNVVLLGLIYAATSYGLVAIVRWALGMFVRQIEAIVGLFARALPLIALLVTFLFLTQEVWQTAGSLYGATYWIAVGLFPLVGVVFVVSRLPRDVGALNDFREPDARDGALEATGAEEFADLVADTPVGPFAVPPEDGVAPALTKREWGNVGLVALFGQGVQIVLVSLAIGVFFVVLGVLLVNETTTQQWAGGADVVVSFGLGNRDLVVTEQLLRVAGFLTAFSGLNFTVYLLTDENYRREFRNEIVHELRQAFAVRCAFRQCLSGS